MLSMTLAQDWLEKESLAVAPSRGVDGFAGPQFCNLLRPGICDMMYPVVACLRTQDGVFEHYFQKKVLDMTCGRGENTKTALPRMSDTSVSLSQGLTVRAGSQPAISVTGSGAFGGIAYSSTCLDERPKTSSTHRLLARHGLPSPFLSN